MSQPEWQGSASQYLANPQNPSLGQVAQTAQGGGEPDIVTKYADTLGKVRDIMAPQKMEHAVPPQHQSWGHILGSVLTMGMLPLQEHEQAARYNAYVDQHNMGVEKETAALARELVAADEHGKLADMDQKIKMANLAIAVEGLKLRGSNAELQKFLAMHKIENENTFGPEGVGAASDVGAVTGQHVEPAGGKGFRLTKNPTTGGYEMPGPGPVQDALHAQGVDTGTTPPSSSAPQSGGDIGGALADLKAKRAAQQKITTDQATANQQFENAAQNVETYFNDPKYEQSANKLLYSGPLSGVVGPVGKYFQEKKPGGSPEAAYLDNARTTILPALRSLEGGIKNFQLRGGKTLEQIGLVKQFNGLTSGRFTPGQAAQLKSAVLARLAQLRALMKEQNAAPGSAPATTSTPTSSTTTTTGASQQTSTGKRYILINP